MPFQIRKFIGGLNLVRFDLVEFDRILEMNLDITLIVKHNAKIFFIKEIEHFAYAPTELLAKSVFTHRARKIIWNIGVNISYPKMCPPLVNNRNRMEISIRLPCWHKGPP